VLRIHPNRGFDVKRKLMGGALSAVVATAALLAPTGTAAMAASPQTWESAGLGNNNMLGYNGTTTTQPAIVDQVIDDEWTVTNMGAINGHHKYHFQAYDEPKKGCLDSHGGKAGAQVYVQPCNSGDYQLWEDFRVTSGSTTYFVWKNLGSYTGQGLNLCLATAPDDSHSVKKALLKTCNTNDVWQRWY
jgi:hypothetical protein